MTLQEKIKKFTKEMMIECLKCNQFADTININECVDDCVSEEFDKVFKDMKVLLDND